MQYAFDFSSHPTLERHRVVLAYDTPNDRRRRRFARIALSYAERVQKSVFEAELTDAQLRVLGKTLAQVADIGDDDIRLYPQCSRCAAASVAVGATARTRASAPLALPRTGGLVVA
jgi:CRISPR-associated protein Cas2